MNVEIRERGIVAPAHNLCGPAPKVRHRLDTKSKVIKKSHLLFLLVFALPVAMFIPTANATIYWQNPSGSADDFDYSNGGSDNGLFGEPNVIGNTLLFEPDNFRAESHDGTSDITSDRLQFDILIHPGKEIKGIRIVEQGDYEIHLAGTIMTTGAMFLTNLSEYEVVSETFQMTPAMPINTSGDGPWSGGVEFDSLGWTKMRVVLNNNLIALSQAGTFSWTEKKRVEIEIIVPEPTTVTLLAMGMAVFLRSKRKHYFR